MESGLETHEYMFSGSLAALQRDTSLGCLQMHLTLRGEQNRTLPEDLLLLLAFPLLFDNLGLRQATPTLPPGTARVVSDSVQ